MGEEKRKSGISTGSTMLVLIFGIVTLTTFSVLAYISARADLKLTNKSKDMALAYYEADARGEALIYEVDTQLQQLAADHGPDDYYEQVEVLYGEKYDTENQILTFEEALNENLAINIKLKVLFDKDTGKNIEISAWNTMNIGEYEMNETLPVWTGEEIE